MKITISTKAEGVYMEATFKSGSFETVSPGVWVDDDGEELGSDYSEALVALARCVSKDLYASSAVRQLAAQAAFIRVYN